MTDAPKPPNRRRRKIIVALVLVLVSLFSWWYWPRGDARFVGRWRAEGTHNAPNLRESIWTFRQNGSATTANVTTANEIFHLHYSWRLDGNRLISGSEAPGWARGILRDLQKQMFRYLHSSFIYGAKARTISFRSANKIVLQSVDDQTEIITLTRIPE